MNRSNIYEFAKTELQILSASAPDKDNRPVIEPFINEILELCDKFGKSGQSGGSAPTVATVISQTVKKLMLFEPICPVLGIDAEWVSVSELSDEILFQNRRCSALFKKGDGNSYYLDAIVWKGAEEYDTFTGRVYIDDKNFELISSRQFVRFPFKPKTFYIDVVRVPIAKEEAESRKMHFIEGNFNECYYTVLKDPKQLEKVFTYYHKD